MAVPENISSGNSWSKGSCLCRGVQFEVAGEPEVCIQCYCNHCQKNAGGPYQICAKFDKTQVTVNQGDQLLKAYVLRDTGSGHDKHKVFCGDCGCTLWTIPMRHGGVHRIVRTSLLENGLKKFPPNKIFFASRSLTPIEHQEGVKSFATQPGL